MRKSLIIALAVVGFLGLSASSCGPTVNPGPNPACASAASAIGTAQQGLGIAQTAWSIGQVFITNATIKLAITAGLDSATAGLATAQTSILAGKCDVVSYVNAAAEAIKVALKAIADARGSAPASIAPSAGPDALSAMIRDGNAKAEQAKAAVK